MGSNQSVKKEQTFHSNVNCTEVYEEDMHESINCNNDIKAKANLCLIKNNISLILKDAEIVIPQRAENDDEKLYLTITFFNSLCEALKHYYHIKTTDAKELIIELSVKNFCQSCDNQNVLSQLQNNHIGDKFITKLICAWLISTKPNSSIYVLHDCFSRVHGSLIVEKIPKQCLFKDALNSLFDIANRSELKKIYELYSSSKIMSLNDYLRFMIDIQKVDENVLTVIEKRFKLRFGNCITRHSFNLALLSDTINSCLQPEKTRFVWQDMTQPLPNYAIKTICVNNIHDIMLALTNGAKCLILNCHLDELLNDVVIGNARLVEAFTVIRDNAFKMNSYPLIVGFNPHCTLTPYIQSRIAAYAKDTFHNMIAKGLMTDGSSIHDPEFSPVALQGKVIFMGWQAPLQPYIGMIISDTSEKNLGIRVINVIEESPAEKCGIQKDDWITYVNNKPVKNTTALNAELYNFKIGQEVIFRKHNSLEVHLVIGGKIVDDPFFDKDFSQLLFLRYKDEKKNEYSKDNNDIEVCWDVVIKTNIAKDNLSCNNNCLKNHLGYVDIKEIDETDSVSYCKTGFQLICFDSHKFSNYFWSTGFFHNNGDCGYVLKRDLNSNLVCDVDLVLLTVPLKYSDCEISCISCCILGSGNVLTNDTNTLSVVNADVYTVVCLHISLISSKKQTHSLVVVFSPCLMREGYRALTCLNNEKKNYNKSSNVVLVNVKVRTKLVY